MSEIKFTINGQPVKSTQGKTVLDVCRENGIDVPTLCHFEGLTDTGSCRLCVVEIEGERRPVPSCTYLIREGIVVKTKTEKLEKYRRQILEIMFAERNHFCMYCGQSGDCELQKLAYRYQMESVRYRGLYPNLPVDTISEFLAIDHNRCVLCGRCVRVCREVAVNRTVDFSGRGGKTMVTADINQPLGESTCTLCGACLQVCPTGAIIDKTGLYKGKDGQCESVLTICPGCSLACEINVFVKDNNLVRTESPVISSTKGSLCRIGRFELINDSRSRITAPLIRNENGQLSECTFNEAIDYIADKFKFAGGECGGLISSSYPNNVLLEFGRFVKEILRSSLIDTTDGDYYRHLSAGIQQSGNGKLPEIDTDLKNIDTADCILVFGTGIEHTHPVLGTMVRRAAVSNKAKLIVIDTDHDMFPLWRDIWLRPDTGTEKELVNVLAKLVGRESATTEIETGKIAGITNVPADEISAAAGILRSANNCVIIYGGQTSGIDNDGLLTGMINLAKLAGTDTDGRLRIIFLKPNVNSSGAWELGLAKRDIKSGKPRALYLIFGDERIDEKTLNRLKDIDFLVVQTGYKSPVTEIADVVLPSPIWSEREGEIISMEGQSRNFRQVLKPVDGMLTDVEILKRLEEKITGKISEVGNVKG